MSCKNPRCFRFMACMTSLFTIAIAIVIAVGIIIAFQNKADAWTIVTKFIYLAADLAIGPAIGTMLFSYASFLDCDCDL